MKRNGSVSFDFIKQKLVKMAAAAFQIAQKANGLFVALFVGGKAEIPPNNSRMIFFVKRDNFIFHA